MRCILCATIRTYCRDWRSLAPDVWDRWRLSILANEAENQASALRLQVRRWVPGVLIAAAVGIAIALSPGARAVAETMTREALGTRKPLPAVLTSPRDPRAFAAGLDVILPPPVVIRSRGDAVARELLNYARSLPSHDVMRTAQRMTEEAAAAGFDPLLFVAVIYVESYFDHLAISAVGAEGLMQLMPATAEWMAERVSLEWPDSHSFDPTLNVTLGIRYFDFLYGRFGRLEDALTAYNRGPAATRYILSTYGRLPHEIHDFYAGKVLDRYRGLLARYGEQENSWSPRRTLPSSL